MASSYSTFKLSENADDREKKFMEMYNSLVHSYFDVDQNFILRVKEILDSGTDLPESTSDSQHYQSAYVLQNAVSDSCFALQNFSDSALEYSRLIKSYSCKTRINICCFGSQAIFAVIGICKVLEIFIEQYGFLDDVRTQIQIFVIDKYREGKSLCESVLTEAKELFHKLNLKLDFCEEDPTENFSDEVKRKISKSHIVAVVKYLSRFSSKKVSRITKDILKSMKENAVLFYMDRDSVGQAKTVKSLVATKTSFSEIKSSVEPEKYKSHYKAKTVEGNLDPNMFPLCWFCNTNMSVISLTWIKKPNIELKSTLEAKTGLKQENLPADIYRPRRSSNTIRNSTEKFRLVGKFATMDMEKKNKDNSLRLKAKEKAVSRYANFDDTYSEY